MKTKKNRENTEQTKMVFENTCPGCAAGMQEVKDSLVFLVNGEEVIVPDSPHLLCQKCGEIMMRLDESRKLREKALELYRGKYKLLFADEILSLRERLDLTQAELAELLRLGVNTISRWESGRNVQTAAMDVLLRLVRDVPGSLEYLRKRAA